MQELCSSAAASASSARSPQAGTAIGAAGVVACAIPRPKGADVDPVADVVYNVLVRLPHNL